MSYFEVVAVAALVCVLAGAVQAITGFGSALVAVPLLSWWVAPEDAVVGVVAMGLALSAIVAWQEWEYVDQPATRRLVGWGVVGLPLGLLVLSLAGEARLRLVIGVTVITLAIVLALGVALPSGARAQRVAGVLSGVLLTSTAMNGPPLVVVLNKMSQREFRATLQAVFAAQGALALAAFVVTGAVGAVAAVIGVVGLVAVRLGWLAGDRVFHGLSTGLFRAGVLAMLGASGVVAVVGALR